MSLCTLYLTLSSYGNPRAFHFLFVRFIYKLVTYLYILLATLPNLLMFSVSFPLRSFKSNSNSVKMCLNEWTHMHPIIIELNSASPPPFGWNQLPWKADNRSPINFPAANPITLIVCPGLTLPGVFNSNPFPFSAYLSFVLWCKSFRFHLLVINRRLLTKKKKGWLEERWRKQLEFLCQRSTPPSPLVACVCLYYLHLNHSFVRNQIKSHNRIWCLVCGAILHMKKTMTKSWCSRRSNQSDGQQRRKSGRKYVCIV